MTPVGVEEELARVRRRVEAAHGQLVSWIGQLAPAERQQGAGFSPAEWDNLQARLSPAARKRDADTQHMMNEGILGFCTNVFGTLYLVSDNVAGANRDLVREVVLHVVVHSAQEQSFPEAFQLADKLTREPYEARAMLTELLFGNGALRLPEGVTLRIDSKAIQETILPILLELPEGQSPDEYLRQIGETVIAAGKKTEAS